MREIGSEFHKVPHDLGRGLTYPRSGTLVFSGRTAIEAVLNHIPDAHTALLPSYCCDSMIAPFRAAGIEVKYYKVEWNNRLRICVDESADIILWCNYFGFRFPMPKFDGVVIEDITHSLISTIPSHPHSDYLVASLRKFEPIICGGYCSVEVDGKAPPDEFVKKKMEAMELKAEYLDNLDEKRKAVFLQLFGNSNQWLAENYSGLLIDSWSGEYMKRVDVELQRRIRIQNAKVLYDGLKGKVEFLFPEEDMDCPLFVPILLDDRDAIRKQLIKNSIYCPVHWPVPEGCRSNIYDRELSLICDQRYGIDDMNRIVSVLLENI